MFKKVLALVIGAMMLVTMAACSSGGDSGGAGSGSSGGASTADGSASGGKKIAFYPNTLNNSFHMAMDETFKRLCDENGYEYVSFDPNWDMNNQIDQMLDGANQNFDAIILIPVDPSGTRQGLEAFVEKGVPIINIDTELDEGDKELADVFITTDCYEAGVLMGELCAKNNPDGAKIAILDFPGVTTCIDRAEGFVEGLGGDPKYEIVAQQSGQAAIDKSMPVAEDIIQANPDLDAFFCINDPSSLGAVAAIEAAQKTGEIQVYSIDASPEGKAAMVDGSFTGVAAQVPIQEAEKAFEILKAYFEGTPFPDEEYRLPSFDVTKEMAEETVKDWQ